MHDSIYMLYEFIKYIKIFIFVSMYKYIHTSDGSGGISFIHSFIPQTFIHHLLQEVFLLGEFHGQSLAGYSPWGCKGLDKTERLTHTHTHSKNTSSKETTLSGFYETVSVTTHLVMARLYILSVGFIQYDRNSYQQGKMSTPIFLF